MKIGVEYPHTQSDEFQNFSDAKISEYQAKISSGKNKIREIGDSLATETSKRIEVGEHNGKRGVLLHPFHQNQSDEE